MRAEGFGFLDGCVGPAGGPPCDRFWAAATATDVRQHDGRRHFAVMKLAGLARAGRMALGRTPVTGKADGNMKLLLGWAKIVKEPECGVVYELSYLMPTKTAHNGEEGHNLRANLAFAKDLEVGEEHET